MSDTQADFGEIKQRLDEIVETVSEEGIDLDEALSLYEEAVKLGIAACDASENLTEEDSDSEDAAAGPDGAVGLDGVEDNAHAASVPIHPDSQNSEGLDAQISTQSIESGQF